MSDEWMTVEEAAAYLRIIPEGIRSLLSPSSPCRLVGEKGPRRAGENGKLHGGPLPWVRVTRASVLAYEEYRRTVHSLNGMGRKKMRGACPRCTIRVPGGGLCEMCKSELAGGKYTNGDTAGQDSWRRGTLVGGVHTLPVKKQGG